MAEDKKINPEELENVAGGEYFETMEDASLEQVAALPERWEKVCSDTPKNMVNKRGNRYFFIHFTSYFLQI